MNINRTTLLAGVATLGLAVGTGLASAQEQQKGPGRAARERAARDRAREQSRNPAHEQ